MKTAFLLPFCLFAVPLFSQKEEARPSQNQHSKRAVVVGIDQYQDSVFVTSEAARRDAEEYAAFLQSKPGGGMARDQILLLTERDATLARFVAALDWLLESREGALLYFAGAAQITAPGGKKEDAALFFHDSPPAPLEGNTFSLRKTEQLLGKNGSLYLLTAAFRQPFLENISGKTEPPPTDRAAVWEADGKAKQSLFFKKKMPQQPPADLAIEEIRPVAHRGNSISNQFVGGLIGLADTDGDQIVTAREAISFLKKGPPSDQSLSSDFFYLAASPRDAVLSKVDEKMLADLRSLGGDDLFPPIVHIESMPAEDRLLEKNTPATRRLYEDFILSIKVKNFIPPPTEGNASTLCDSLLKMPELQPIAGQLRRRLAAAMLDDTQQALNAYLNNSAKELDRRRKNPGQYATYAKMLGHADGLLGERHYMHKSLVAKQLYFEGLSARLHFFSKKDTTLLRAALEKQRAALASEPEAAYILNELGVVHLNLGERGEARRQFLAATEFSPAWGIPFVNLSLLSVSEKNWPAARELAIKAVSLAPWNPAGYQLLGFICQNTGELATAESLQLRAIRLGADPAEPEYNLACIAAVQGKKGAALDWLRLALVHGFDDTSKLALDPDLDGLRGLPEWRLLMEKHFAGRPND